MKICLLDQDEQEAVYIMRRAFNGMKADEAGRKHFEHVCSRQRIIKNLWILSKKT